MRNALGQIEPITRLESVILIVDVDRDLAADDPDALVVPMLVARVG